MYHHRLSGLVLVLVTLAVGSVGYAAEKSEKPAYPPLSEVTEGLTEVPGMMTLYKADASDPKQDHTTLLCRIPRSLIGKDLLFATSISRGRYAGYMWQDWLVRWEIVGKHVKLVVPNIEYVQTPGTPVNEAIERTYRPTYLAAMPIVSMAGKDPVVDLGALVFSNVADPPYAASGSVRPNRALSTLRKVKNFPENILIDADIALSSSVGGETVGVSYAFRKLPKLGGAYKPRPSDERVGYFTTTRQDWSSSYASRETALRYANRWHLEKQDPSLELSPPKEPIVFIIEKTVPIRWRRWVRAGIEEWNKAFEEIGYVDAIVVQQQTETNEFADIDPEDARYNFIRWIVSGRAFAMGPSVADPRTGQILDADIIFDDSMARWFNTEFDQLGPASMEAVRGSAYTRYEAMMDYALEHGRVDAETAEMILGDDDRTAHQHGATCELAHGLQQQMALGLMAARVATPSGKEVPEQFIGEVIKEVTTHEVGHTLGLRHNFKASAWLSMDEIRKRRDLSDKPLSASVMDYNPITFFKGDSYDRVRHFVTPVIGPYDYWAIAYGYGDPKKGQSMDAYLSEVASRSTEPAHAYATDEDTMYMLSPDPLVNRWDLSSDNMEWLKSRNDLADELIASLADWGIQPDEPRHYLRNLFSALLYEKTQPGYYVARYVGGQYFSRSRMSDPDAGPALTHVDAELMREALASLNETVFNPESFRFDPELLNNLPRTRWRDVGSMTKPIEFPIHEAITRYQAAVLNDLLTIPILQRVYDSELANAAEDKFTAAEYLQTLTSLVWPELESPPAGPYTDAAPMISSISRNLQSKHVVRLMLYVRADLSYSNLSPDLQRMIRFNLRDLGTKIEGVLESKGDALDYATKAHLTETHSQIMRCLEAEFAAR